uniref:(northern house mosquito) hypothetical protein n=1 Tax=Culex pipiens TaxID=7175 RepID=A0A8D8NI18_CULPI
MDLRGRLQRSSIPRLGRPFLPPRTLLSKLFARQIGPSLVHRFPPAAAHLRRPPLRRGRLHFPPQLELRRDRLERSYRAPVGRPHWEPPPSDDRPQSPHPLTCILHLRTLPGHRFGRLSRTHLGPGPRPSARSPHRPLRVGSRALLQP